MQKENTRNYLRNKRIGRRLLKKLYLDFSIFRNTNLTIFESLVKYLKEEGYTYRKIGLILGRDERNIWTVYARARSKSG